MAPMAPDLLPDDIARFIAEHVDSVPHLEALLLLWESAPQPWTAEALAQRIYIPAGGAALVLADLALKGWIIEADGAARFDPQTRDAALIERLARSYRGNLLSVARAIHQKSSSALLDFARAFRLRKD